MVKELVPQVGSRSKIFKKIEELKSTNRNSYSGQNTLSDQDQDQDYLIYKIPLTF